jgi:hypothetical protein
MTDDEKKEVPEATPGEGSPADTGTNRWLAAAVLVAFVLVVAFFKACV